MTILCIAPKFAKKNVYKLVMNQIGYLVNPA